MDSIYFSRMAIHPNRKPIARKLIAAQEALDNIARFAGGTQKENLVSVDHLNDWTCALQNIARDLAGEVYGAGFTNLDVYGAIACQEIGVDPKERWVSRDDSHESCDRCHRLIGEDCTCNPTPEIALHGAEASEAANLTKKVTW